MPSLALLETNLQGKTMRFTYHSEVEKNRGGNVTRVIILIKAHASYASFASVISVLEGWSTVEELDLSPVVP